MDRSTKERLTGAIVLVAVAWLVIPVFLDGPEEDTETLRQRVELPGRDKQQTQTKTILLEPAARETPAPEKVTDPPPATRTLPAPPAAAEPPRREPEQPAAAADPAGQATPAVVESDADEASVDEDAPPPAPESVAEQKPAAAAALWAVQLGSFSNQTNAERLAAGLRKKGFAAFLSRVDAGGKSLHRVRVGPQASRAEAEQVAAKLKTAGHSGQVVSHP